MAGSALGMMKFMTYAVAWEETQFFTIGAYFLYSHTHSLNTKNGSV